MNERWKRYVEILLVSSRLGLTSFGGPIAHIGYFREEYVLRRKWLDEGRFADLNALCQFLPGPASSQLGMSVGIHRGGWLGGVLSFLGFTLPSAFVLALFAFFAQNVDLSQAGWLHGLKLVAVAVVAQAIWGMGRKLTPDAPRISLAVCAAAASLLWSQAYVGISIIIAVAILGLFFPFDKEALATPPAMKHSNEAFLNRRTRRTGLLFLLLFIIFLVALPFARQWFDTSRLLAIFDSFYRSGSLVFGGGHVVLPMLEKEVVPPGWVSQEQFLTGYGAAQAVPGPLFTFASYLGGTAEGWTGAVVATLAIFLPSYLLVAGVTPYWERLRSNRLCRSALTAVNAAVVGLLLAAFYHPIWTSSIATNADFIMALCLFVLLTYWKLPPWTIVIIGALAGYAMELWGIFPST